MENPTPPARTVRTAAILLLLAGLAGFAAGAPPVTRKAASPAPAATPAPRALIETLVVWHPYRGPARTAFEKVVADYRGSTGFRAVAIAMPRLPDEVASQVPRGEGPDLFVYGQERLGAWVRAGGIVEPLRNPGSPADAPLRARLLPGMLDALTVRGVPYGVPLAFRTVTLVYNKSLVPDAPLTTREMMAQARRLTSPALGKFGLATWYTDLYYHAPLMNAFGAQLFDAAGAPAIDSLPMVQSVATMKRWIKDGALPAEPSTTLIVSLFNEQKLAMVIAGPSFFDGITPGLPFALGVLPAVDEAGGKPMRPWVTVEGMYVAATSRHKAAAFELARYLADLPAARVLATEGKITSAVAAVYQDPQVSGDPVLSGFRKQLDTSAMMPNVPGMAIVWSPVSRALEAALERKASPQDALANAQRTVLQRLDKH